MILDAYNEFSDAQAVTATAISTNVIDTNIDDHNTTQDLGARAGWDLELVIQVTEDFATATSVTFSLESDSTADLATSATVHWTSDAIVIASLTNGTQVARVKLPKGEYERYLGVRYTIGGSSATAGKVNAFLVEASQDNRSYANNSTIS